MSLSGLLDIKGTFRPAEPVSYSWYNAVAAALKRLRALGGLTALSTSYPGFDPTAIQTLMNVTGTIQWVTVEECP